MSGKRSRDKGKVGEREAAKELSRILGINMRRGQQYSGLGGDDVVGWSGVHVEVKRAERLSPYVALAQATADTKFDEVPLVLHRKNGQRWILICELDQLPLLSICVQEAMRSDK